MVKARKAVVVENKISENKKVFEDSDENFLIDNIDDFENDEDQVAITNSSVNELEINQTGFEINRFFNELPIRILNSHQLPFFYAEDICKALGIKRINTCIRDFNSKEIVSPELRKKYNIITYQKYKAGFRRNDKMILLTEFGVYCLIMNSRGQLADQFRDFIYDVLYQLRTTGEYKVTAELEKLKITNKEQAEQIDKLKQKQSEFKALCDEITLVEYPNDPYKIIQTNVPRKFLKKYAERNIVSNMNSIDDPVPHAYRLAQELSIPCPCIDAPIETPSHDLQSIHAKNIEIARSFVELNSHKNSYLVTTETSPELLTECTVLHRVYVKSRDLAMRELGRKLADYKSERVSSRVHWYSCDKNLIIKCMNAVAD